MNTYIKEDKIGKYIMFKGEERLYLEDRPIAFQRAIVCRGRPVVERRDVVRSAGNSWSSSHGGRIRGHAEGDLLKLAKERNVWGVARLFGH